MSLHFYTSCNNSYLHKAYVLAETIKKYHPDAQMHIILNERKEAVPKFVPDIVDYVHPIEELKIEPFEPWVFKHTVVELCTAVKGIAALMLFNKFAAKNIIYLDPDVALFESLDPVLESLEKYSIVLTPHLTKHDMSIQAIIDNEVSALKHGTYNLGFIGIRNDEQGHNFVKWWAERLNLFCYDDIANGIFTDQRWIDLVPGLFDNVGILRNSSLNVATWNLLNRNGEGSVDKGLFVNGEPLRFFHFSGFDNGALDWMLDRYSDKMSFLPELKQWYQSQLDRWTDQALTNQQWSFATYYDGTPIEKIHRITFRNHQEELSAAFPDPFSLRFKEWVMARVMPVPSEESIILSNILRSKTYRIASWLRKIYRTATGVFPSTEH